MNESIAIIAMFAACGVIGAMIGKPRGRAAEGFFLSLFLGLIGWIITAVLPRTAKSEAAYQDQVSKYRT